MQPRGLAGQPKIAPIGPQGRSGQRRHPAASGALRILRLINDNNSNDKDVLRLKLIKNSPARQGSGLGNPTLDAIYTACVWEGGSLIAGTKVPPGGNWRAPRNIRGYRYKDQTASSDGLKVVKVLAGPTGNAKETKVIVKGKGGNLPDPTVPVSTPVDITAQVIDSNSGLCFGDTFDDATVKKNAPNANNTVRIFKAKKP